MTQSQPAQPEGTLAALRRHPYLLLAAACLPFAALNRPSGIDPSMFVSLVLLLAVTAFYVCLAYRGYADCGRSFAVLFVPLCIVYAALPWMLWFVYKNPGLCVAATGLCVALALCSYWRTLDKLDAERIVLLLIIFSASYFLGSGTCVRLMSCLPATLYASTTPAVPTGTSRIWNTSTTTFRCPRSQ